MCALTIADWKTQGQHGGGASTRSKKDSEQRLIIATKQTEWLWGEGLY